MTTRRQPVPAVEATTQVAPLVDIAAEPAAVARQELAVEVAPEPMTRFVVAEHTDLEVRAVLARSALAQMPGWAAVQDVPDDAPLPQLPPTRPVGPVAG